MGRNKLYTLLGVICLTGYIWLFFSMYNEARNSGYSPCLFKNATTFPCPSCGSTRALMLLLHGDVAGSVLLNPFGILSAILLAAVPFWMLYDLISRKQTLFGFYKKSEQAISIRWVAIVLILLVLTNWIWNIHKNL